MSKNILTIVALPDLHGKTPYKLNEISSKFDIIITPGDICLDNMKNAITKSSLNEFHKQSIQGGEDVLEFLSSFNKPIYIVPGNWEPTQYSDGIKREERDLFKEMLSKFALVHNCEDKKVTIENTNISIIGTGSTSAPEIISKAKLHEKLQYEDDEEEIQELRERYLYQKERFNSIDRKFKQLQKNNTENDTIKILLSHNSPYNTPLDIIKNPFNPLHNQHYGSILARAIIENHQPELVISGHIHEGVGICIINNSICLNTGFGDDIYHIIKIDMKSRKIINIKKFGKNGA